MIRHCNRALKRMAGHSVFAAARNVEQEPNFRNSTRSILEEAAEHTKLPSSFIESLKNCEITLKAQLALRMDDGSLQKFSSYRVHHNSHSLPMTGGIRYSAASKMMDCEALSMLNTIKLALVDLPLGGSSGAVQVDTSDLSEHEIMRLTRRYSEVLYSSNMTSPSIDIPGIELGVNPNIMAVMMDTYRNHKNDVNALASVTGKPFEIGGVTKSVESGAIGAYVGMKEICNNPELLGESGILPGLSNKTYILMGFGRLGSNLARILTEREEGVKIIGVLEWDGATYNPEGLDIPELIEHFETHNTVKGFDGGETYSRHKFILEQHCDVLVTATTEHAININNVKDLDCQIVVEAANGAVTGKADKFLKDKGVFVVPDIILNSGSLITGYLEYIKNLGHIELGKLSKRWTESSTKKIYQMLERMEGVTIDEDIQGAEEEELVISCLEDIIQTAVEETVATAQKHDLSLRLAGWVNALKRIHLKKSLK